MNKLDPNEFIITRKRKKYRFALFHNSPLCFELEEWPRELVPSVLELGAGTGMFSVALAQAAPTAQYVAVDVKADRLQTGAQSASEKYLTNLRFLRARADQLPELLVAHSLDSLWVTFPDPFPKGHHAKHRLTHPRFLDIYAGLLKEDSALYFKTDAKELFDWSLEQFVAKSWKIEKLSFDLHDSTLSEYYKIQTAYETRYMREGLKINFVKATPPFIVGV
jgi:tRNA (guanine-N7-)-methyltransferase